MVDFGILGPLRVAFGGSEADPGGGRRRGLLGRLLVDANCVVPLERLVDDLLPHDGEAAMGTMRTYVSRLRGVVGGDRIVTRSPGYLLVVEPGELDADRFEALVAQAHEPGRPPEDAIRLLDEALGLWRGPALAEFADRPWARPVAERLHRRQLDATADRLEALLACGRPRDVAGEAEGLVRRHPFDERLWGILVVAHYQCGRQADALRAYQRARLILIEELGTEPSPALRALEQAVLRQDADLAPPSPGAGPPRATGSPASVRTAPTTRVPAATSAGPEPPLGGEGEGEVRSDLSWVPPRYGALVGRQAAMDRLLEQVAAARDGAGGMVLLDGDAGAGKTRLLAALAHQADDQGCLVLYGRCEEDGLVPYQPFVTALAPVLGQALSLGLIDLGPLAADLAVLFPDVPGGDPVPVAGLDPETRRHRLFEAIDRCFGQLADRRTVVLLLDDLHYADHAVARLLHRVLQAGPTRRLLVVAGLRAGELGASNPVTTTLLDLRRRLPVVDVPVTALSEGDVAELLVSWPGHETADVRAEALDEGRRGLAHNVHVETGGNALFVTELIRELVGGGVTSAGAPAAAGTGQAATSGVGASDEGPAGFEVPSAAPVGGLPLPATTADLIVSRVSRLPTATRQLLDAAAVVGMGFDLAVAADVAGLDDGTAIDAVDEAMARGIVVDVPAPRGRLSFSHAIVRRALYTRLASPRRARLHLTTARALERRTVPGRPEEVPDDIVEALAHHFGEAAAGGATGTADAVRYARLAGERAVVKLSYETAIEHLRRALALLDAAGPSRQDEDDRLRRGELLLLLGEALNQGGDTEEAKEHLLAAAAIATADERSASAATSASAPVTRAALAFGGALPAGVGLPDERGIALLYQAIDAQPPDARRQRALLLGRLAEAEYLTAPRHRRAELCTEAVAIARQLGDPRTLATVLVNRCWALAGPDDVEATLGSALEVERIADALGDVELALHGRKCRLHTLVTLDAWPDVLELAEDLRRRAEEIRQPEYERLALSFSAVLAGNAGRFDEAERLAAEVHELLLKRRGQRAHADVVHVLQHVPWRWLQSRIDDMLEPTVQLTDVRQAQPYWSAMLDPRPAWHAPMAWLLAECGRSDEAAEHLRAAALPDYLRGDRGADFWYTTTSAALAATRLGDHDHARLLYEHLLPYRDRNAFIGQVAFLGCVEHHLGLLARVLGRPEANDHLHRARARYRAMGATAYAAHVEEQLTTRHPGGSSPSALAAR